MPGYPPNMLAALLNNTSQPAQYPANTLATLLNNAYWLAPVQTVKRHAFFSFHFDDVMRVNVVRNAWKIDHPDAPQMRSFFDSSLWERRQLEGPDAVKRLIREGVQSTSAVCVLVGTGTWERRWVRYEIARAINDNRGLLAVHINSIRHHITKQPSPLGHNPLGLMAIQKEQLTFRHPPKYYLVEYNRGKWTRYADYDHPVDLPRYLTDPRPGERTLLFSGTRIYDYVGDDGHRNIGSWIDAAARAVGR
jgi:hypothetical protein